MAIGGLIVRIVRKGLFLNHGDAMSMPKPPFRPELGPFPDNESYNELLGPGNTWKDFALFWVQCGVGAMTIMIVMSLCFVRFDIAIMCSIGNVQLLLVWIISELQKRNKNGKNGKEETPPVKTQGW